MFAGLCATVSISAMAGKPDFPMGKGAKDKQENIQQPQWPSGSPYWMGREG